MYFDYRSLGYILRRLRKERGLSQDVLSGLAGISRSHLSMIECASMEPTLDTLYKIAQALDIPVSEILRQQEAETKKSE